MKTKEEILHELTHEQMDEFDKDPEGFDGYRKEREQATIAKDLKAIISFNLAGAISREPIGSNMTQAEKKDALFKTIFVALMMMEIAEKRYEEQFKTEEK